MRHKTFDLIETKAGGAPGEFTALVAVFGNVDRGGDRIMSGAFTKTIKKWQDSKDPLPIILSHQWNDPMAHIGVAQAKDMRQTPKGLLIKGKLDIEDNPIAKQVHKLMQRRSLKEFSIGFGVPKDGEAINEKDGANELHEIDLVEAGPTLKGMNESTELLAIKSALGAEEEKDPPSEAELRRASAQVDRDAEAARLPDAIPKVDAMTAALEKANERLETSAKAIETLTKALAEPRTEAELRKATDQLDREQIGEHLPEPEPGPDPLRVAQAELASAKAEVVELQGKLAKVPEPPAASETELRRASDLLDRDEIKAQLPETPGVEPAPSPVERLADRVATAEKELADVKSAQKPPPASEKDLRRASERVERGKIAEQLPDTNGQPAASPVADLLVEMANMAAELKAVNERLDAAEKTPPADEGTLRRASDQLEREKVAADLPASDAEPAPDPVVVLNGELDRLRSEVVRLVKIHSVGRAYAGKQLASDLRMKLEAVGQERFGSTNTYAYVDDFDPDRGWVIFCVFSEGTPARFIQVEYTKESDGVALSTEEMEVVRSTTYQPLNQPKSAEAVRPADPLRQRSDQTVLEIQSGGASLRKPPPTPKVDPEPVLDEQELRQRSYEVTLALLTEGTA